MENFIYIITGVVAIAVFLYYSIKPANSGTTFHYPQEHLQEIKHKIAFYPINEQVQYAGSQIKSRVNDPDYVRAFLDGAEFDVMGDFDTTTVGNLAYIALYSHIGDARERASAYIRAYARWVKDHGFVSGQEIYDVSSNDTNKMSEHKKAINADEARKIQEEYKDKPHGWIQWKGTDVCMDVYCKCGHHSHVDSEFAYYIKCPKCKAVYMCNAHIELIELEQEPENGVIVPELDDESQ